MARLLLVATPLLGHLGPLLTIGRALEEDGHDVEVLTGESMRHLVEQAGLRLLPLRPAAVAETVVDGGHGWLAPRWSGARRDVIGRFIAPLRAQAADLESAIAAGDYAVVLADTAFLGVLPILLADGDRRPPVIGISVTPLSYLSSDAAPFGSGIRHRDTARARQRNHRIDWFLQRGPLRPIHDALHEALLPWRPREAVNYFNVVGMFDITFQLGVPELEYPRRQLPSSVHCIGPVPAFSAGTTPAWLAHLEDRAAGRPVVHVTQGTVDNSDLGRLVVPTIQALLDDFVLVVGTGGAHLAGAGRTTWTRAGSGDHPSVLVTDFIPYAELMPRVDLVITNGGWGGIQQAARHGVPLVVAGATEEKPEAAARVAWAGLGVNLRTGRPSPTRLRRAAHAALGNDLIRANSERLSLAARTRPDPIDEVVTAVNHLCAAGRTMGLRSRESEPRR